MKELILYFLFFVVAALILIQCAKVFPSNDQSPDHQLKNVKTAGIREDNKPAKTALITPEIKNIKPGFEIRTFNSLFDGQDLPLSMMKYINHYSFLNYNYISIINYRDFHGRSFFFPYTDFSSAKLLSNKSKGLQAYDYFVRK